MSSLFDIIETHPHVSERYRDYSPPALPNLSGCKELFVDFETTGLKYWMGDKPIGTAVCTLEGDEWYFGTGHVGGGNIDEDQFKRWANSDEGFKGKLITNFNTRFEVHMGREFGVNFEELGCRVSDVGHYVALLDDHRFKNNLDAAAFDYLGERKIELAMDKSRMRYSHAAEVAKYACQDVQLVRKLKARLWPMLDDQELQDVRQLEDEVIFVVAEMEHNAAPLHLELLKRWDAEIAVELNQIFFVLYKETGLKINPDKNADWEKLFNYLKLPITDLTETGKPSFTDDVRNRHQHPMVKLARRAGKLSSLRSKYLKKYIKTVEEHGGDAMLLRYALHQLRADEGGTISGRFSSSGLTVNGERIGANIQQVMEPDKQRKAFGSDDYIIKEVFKPASGLWLSADAAQIEYRLFAHYAESKKIIETYRLNPDTKFHDLIWDMLRPYKPDLLYKEVKNLNFATIYGAGLAKIANMMGYISDARLTELRQVYPKGVPSNLPELHEALAIKQIYDREIPEVGPLLRRASGLAESRGWVKTLLGRRTRFINGNRAHKALNSIIQGSAADIMKRKLVELHNARKKTGFVMRMTVHDEVCGDIPNLESASMVEEILNRQSFVTKVPIKWDVEVGPSWGQCVPWREYKEAA